MLLKFRSFCFCHHIILSVYFPLCVWFCFWALNTIFIFSSHEITRDQSPAHQKLDHFPAQDPSISMPTAPNDEAELNPTPVHTTEILDKSDTVQNFGDKKDRKSVV